jgi:hypothetical protein
LVSYIRPFHVSFSRRLDALAAISKGENKVLKFERDLAPRGAEFEDLHAESKLSSESLNLIFSSLFLWCYVLFYCFEFLLFSLEHAWLITLLGVMTCSTWIFLVKLLGIRSFLAIFYVIYPLNLLFACLNCNKCLLCDLS